MATASEADFARMHDVSREAVRKWKTRGYLRLSGDRVLVEQSDAQLRDAGKGRFARKRQLSTEPVNRQPERVNSAPKLTVVDAGEPRFVTLAMPPSGAHPLACYAAATAESAAHHVAELLLPRLPADQVRELAERVAAQQHRGTIECLELDGVEPPAGLSSWAAWEGFARPALNDVEWAELLESAAQRPIGGA